MTARFERLGMVDHLLLVGLLSAVSIFLFPSSADASVASKTRLVLEIKNFHTLTIPGVEEIQAFMNKDNDSAKVAETPVVEEITPPMPVTPPPAPAVKVVAASKSPAYKAPPKAVNKVYMHEPEIRAYMCPKLGDKCNTFIAILKAENGTHECTRDNRGTNRNGSIDIGLTQINWTPASPYTFEQLQDCKFNLDIAYKKYQSRGFQPWAAYNSGRYKKHLPAVIAAANAAEVKIADTINITN